MNSYTIFQDMTAPTLTVLVTDSDGAARNLVAATSVKLYVGKGATKIIDGVAMTQDGPTGQVSLVLTPTQTATPGVYSGQVEIDWGNGVLERTRWFTVVIAAKV